MFARVIRREGGHVQHPADRGGETAFGLTERLARSLGYRGPMAALTATEAVRLYTVWFQQLGLWGWPVTAGLTLALADLLADAIVHHGPRAGLRQCQRALGVPDDGRAGPVTRAALRAADPGSLAWRLLAERASALAAILRRQPSQRVFAAGWMRRIGDLAAAQGQGPGSPRP